VCGSGEAKSVCVCVGMEEGEERGVSLIYLFLSFVERLV
jgi:hypothetical protein